MEKTGKVYYKISFILSAIWFLLLIYNVFAAKVIPAIVNLCIFVITNPIFFRTFKERHQRFFKVLSGILAVPLLIMIIVTTGGFTGMNDTIPTDEQGYIDTVLSQITTETTIEGAVDLLGTPDRNLGLKVNWLVTIAERNSRVGVYFSVSGKANDIVLDGGPGRFYYRKSLE